jgi:hypothetical protein
LGWITSLEDGQADGCTQRIETRSFLWHPLLRMWPKVFTTLICLIALFTEVTLNTSTSFVREFSSPSVGKLVMLKMSVEKKQDLPHLPGAPDHVPTHDQCDDLAHFDVASCAGQIAMPVVLQTVLPVSRLVLVSTPLYSESRPSRLERPPSA